MLNVYSRHRSLALLVAVVFAQILLLAFQIKRDRDVPLIRYWAADLVTPVGRVGTWTSSKIRGVWTGYIGLHGARVENARLQSELDRLRLQELRARNRSGRSAPLAAASRFPPGSSGSPDARRSGDRRERRPDVSHALHQSRFRATIFAATWRSSLPKASSARSSKCSTTTPPRCLLINDKDSGVGALFDDSRTHGVVKGTGDPLPDHGLRRERRKSSSRRGDPHVR